MLQLATVPIDPATNTLHYAFGNNSRHADLTFDPTGQTATFAASPGSLGLSIVGSVNVDNATGGLALQTPSGSQIATLSITPTGISGTAASSVPVDLGGLRARITAGQLAFSNNGSSNASLTVVPSIPAVFGGQINSALQLQVVYDGGLFVRCPTAIPTFPLNLGFSIPSSNSGFGGLALNVSSLQPYCTNRGTTPVISGVNIDGTLLLPKSPMKTNVVVVLSHNAVHVVASPKPAPMNLEATVAGLQARIDNFAVSDTPSETPDEIDFSGDVSLAIGSPAILTMEPASYTFAISRRTATLPDIQVRCSKADEVSSQPNDSTAVVTLEPVCKDGWLDGVKTLKDFTWSFSTGGANRSITLKPFTISRSSPGNIDADTEGLGQINFPFGKVSVTKSSIMDSYTDTNPVHDFRLDLRGTIDPVALFAGSTFTFTDLAVPLSSSQRLALKGFEANPLEIGDLKLSETVPTTNAKVVCHPGVTAGVQWDSTQGLLTICGALQLPDFLSGEQEHLSVSGANLRTTASAQFYTKSDDARYLTIHSLKFDKSGMSDVDVGVEGIACDQDDKKVFQHAVHLGAVEFCLEKAQIIPFSDKTDISMNQTCDQDKQVQSDSFAGGENPAVLICAKIGFQKYVDSNGNYLETMALFNKDLFVASGGFNKNLTVSYGGQTITVSSFFLGLSSDVRDLSVKGAIESKQLDYSTFYFKTVGLRQEKVNGEWMLPKPHANPDWQRTGWSFLSRVGFQGLSGSVINLFKSLLHGI